MSEVTAYDVLFGVEVLRPQLAVRMDNSEHGRWATRESSGWLDWDPALDAWVWSVASD